MKTVCRACREDSETLKGTDLKESTVRDRRKALNNVLTSSIQIAEARGPKLQPCNVIYKHILFILKDKQVSKWHGQDYCMLLWSSFLSKSIHRNQMTNKYWLAFVEVVCNELSESKNTNTHMFILLNYLMMNYQNMPQVSTQHQEQIDRLFRYPNYCALHSLNQPKRPVL